MSRQKVPVAHFATEQLVRALDCSLDQLVGYLLA